MRCYLRKRVNINICVRSAMEPQTTEANILYLLSISVKFKIPAKF